MISHIYGIHVIILSLFNMLIGWENVKMAREAFWYTFW